MARIRTIKPSFWSDGGVVRLTRDARLLMVGLMSFADDEGRFVGSPAAIIGYVYPHDDDVSPTKLRKWVTEIEKHCHLVMYQVDGLAYGVLDKFRDHQRISHPQESTLPPPPAAEVFHA